MKNKNRTSRPVTPNLLREDLAHAEATTGISRAHEGTVSGRLGGRRTSGSGNKECDPGDVKGVRVGPLELLIECKTTSAASIKFEASWLVKITEEAGLTRVPAVSVKFGREVLDRISRGRYRRVIATEEEWIMVPLSVFERLVNAAEDE